MTRQERIEELKVLIRHRRGQLFSAAHDMQRAESELDTTFLDEVKKQAAKLDEYIAELDELLTAEIHGQYPANEQ